MNSILLLFFFQINSFTIFFCFSLYFCHYKHNSRDNRSVFIVKVYNFQIIIGT